MSYDNFHVLFNHFKDNFNKFLQDYSKEIAKEGLITKVELENVENLYKEKIWKLEIQVDKWKFLGIFGFLFGISSVIVYIIVVNI